MPCANSQPTNASVGDSVAISLSSSDDDHDEPATLPVSPSPITISSDSDEENGDDPERPNRLPQPVKAARREVGGGRLFHGGESRIEARKVAALEQIADALEEGNLVAKMRFGQGLHVLKSLKGMKEAMNRAGAAGAWMDSEAAEGSSGVCSEEEAEVASIDEMMWEAGLTSELEEEGRSRKRARRGD